MGYDVTLTPLETAVVAWIFDSGTTCAAAIRLEVASSRQSVSRCLQRFLGSCRMAFGGLPPYALRFQGLPSDDQPGVTGSLTPRNSSSQVQRHPPHSFDLA